MISVASFLMALLLHMHFLCGLPQGSLLQQAPSFFLLLGFFCRRASPPSNLYFPLIQQLEWSPSNPFLVDFYLASQCRLFAIFTFHFLLCAPLPPVKWCICCAFLILHSLHLHFPSRMSSQPNSLSVNVQPFVLTSSKTYLMKKRLICWLYSWQPVSTIYKELR